MKIFAEYRVKADCHPEYFDFVEKLKGLYPTVRVYEGVYQPGLFVEEWSDCEEQFFSELKTARQDPRHPFWSQLDQMIDGGREKANIWLFREQ